MSKVNGAKQARTTCSFCECPVFFRRESIGDETKRGKALQALCSYRDFRIVLPPKCSMELTPFCNDCEKLVSHLYNCLKSGSQFAKKAEQLYANIEQRVVDGEVVKCGPKRVVPVDDVRRLKWTGLTNQILEGYRKKLENKQLITNNRALEGMRMKIVKQEPGTRKRDVFGRIASAAPSGIAGNNSVAFAMTQGTFGRNRIQIKQERVDPVISSDGLGTSIGTLAALTQPKSSAILIQPESERVPAAEAGPSTPIFYGPGPFTSWHKPLAAPPPPVTSPSEKVTAAKRLVANGNSIKFAAQINSGSLGKRKRIGEKVSTKGVLEKMKKYVPTMPGVRYNISLREALTMGTFTLGGVQIWVCPVCQKEEDDDVSGDMVCCDVCDDWFHWKCVGITKKLPKDHPWYCKRCLFDYSDNPKADFPKLFPAISK